MPSVLHETLVRLFRSRGELAPALLRICESIVLRHDHAEPGSIDLSQVASTEYRADSVTVLKERNGSAVSAIVVEIQLAADRDKVYTWPLYVAALRAELRCPVYLLVIAGSPEVARWAGSVIDLGHPDFHLQPLVLDFDRMPRSMEPELVEQLPELAVLSAIAHPEVEPVERAFDAIHRLAEDDGGLYFDLVLSRLPDAVRRAVENRMRTYEYQSDFARKYFGQGREEGREQGREEGREQGREEGREQGLRVAIQALVRARLGELTAADSALIAGVRDEAALTALIDALAHAVTERDVRAALAASAT